MLVGGFHAGGGALDGEIVDLAARGIPGGVDLSWRHEGAPEFAGRLVVAVDGAPAAVLPGGAEWFSLAGLEGGEHRVEVVPLRADVRHVPDLHGAAYGRRVYLRWPASASEDARRYWVFWDAGTGTVLEEPIGVVDGTVVHGLLSAAPTTGSGTGRVTVVGDWRGDAVNEVFRIEVGAGGRFRHDVLGEWSGWELIGRGTVELGLGVRAEFESVRGLYQAGDEWEFRVGPPTEWSSGELGEGVYRFTVRAGDAAGNVSDALEEREVAVLHAPDMVTGVAVAWDGEEVSLSWTLPGGAPLDAVVIYANFSKTFGELADRIIESGPWETLAGNATGLVFAPAVEGVWRFFVRAVRGGRRSDSIEVVEVDTAGLATGVELRVPEQVAVIPTAGGSFRVEWAYPVEGGGDVESFVVYMNDESAEELVFAAMTEVEVVAADGLPGVGVGWFAAEIEGPFGTAQRFTVRARDGEGNETQNTDAYIGEPDSAPPSLDEPLLGVSN